MAHLGGRLVTICKIKSDPVSEEVVRWCSDCGAIVIDVDYDGRTNPGQVMKMTFPKLGKPCGS